MIALSGVREERNNGGNEENRARSRCSKGWRERNDGKAEGSHGDMEIARETT